MEDSCSKSQLEGRTLASAIDNHQEWQSQVESKLSDLTADQQSKDLKTVELIEAQSTEAHSRNDRLEDKLKRLECQVEEQRRQILHLESIPRMAKQELNTPDKDIPRKLFMEQSSQSHSQNDPPGNSSGSNQAQASNPPQSHSGNDKGGTDCAALRETVRRLSFWIMQITGAMDIEENPDNVSFPNGQTCRELSRLKKEVETLQNQCKECHSKNPGGDPLKISSLEKNGETLKEGLKATMGRLDQFLSHQKRDHAQVQDMQRNLDLTGDELAAWAVHFQQPRPELPGISENQAESQPPNPVLTTVLTAMASQGDIEPEVTDPEKYPIGKYIVIQESLIYMLEGKVSLILDRPLCRDFLAGTSVLEDGEIYLRNPQSSHSNNGEQGIPIPSQRMEEILQILKG